MSLVPLDPLVQLVATPGCNVGCSNLVLQFRDIDAVDVAILEAFLIHEGFLEDRENGAGQGPQ